MAWTVAWLERQLHAEMCELKHGLHAALLDYTLEQKTFDLHWDQAQELSSRVQRHKTPWLKIEGGPSRQAARALTGNWKRVFGDPDDPEVARRIEATAAALRERVARGNPEVGSAFAR